MKNTLLKNISCPFVFFGCTIQYPSSYSCVLMHLINRLKSTMELAMVANKLRQSLKAVAVLMEAHDTRLSFDQLLSLCAESTPSQVGKRSVRFYKLFNCCVTLYVLSTVPIGGYLFEYFLWTRSGYALFRVFGKSVRASPGAAIPLDLQQQLMTSLSGKFIGWLLFHVACLGSNGRKQMFYMTFVNHYFGLSRRGIKYLSRYGYATNLTRFDDMRRGCLLSSQHKTRYTPSFIRLWLVEILFIAWFCVDCVGRSLESFKF